jgi:hypothetical protein
VKKPYIKIEETPIIKCKHCNFIFKIIVFDYPQRKGCYCSECGEYLPYVWDEKINWNEVL